EVRRQVGIRRVAYDYREPPFLLDLVDRLRLVCERWENARKGLLPDMTRWLERIRQIDPRPLGGTEAVAGLVELEPDLEVGDGVGRHQKLVAMQPRQQVPGDVVVPE